MSSLTERERAAQRFHALSDATRLGILDCLRSGEQCVCDLTEAFQVGQSLLSFHLKTLKDAGLVTDRREGRWVYYVVNPTALAEVGAFVSTLTRTAPTDSPTGQLARRRSVRVSGCCS